LPCGIWLTERVRPIGGQFVYGAIHSV